ncbi:hypothetical protein [Nitratiruptor sp. YY09-18]|uniref:hypothetical protein n=1 Tax=Nitratiruptor sp. YY09-18 TaxID=2724901 RepID=UPI001916BDEE|nr:hypothetical protein [Nitratiruptor sp. YY09-18]BCD67489.1 hypothetical protein NitYY0918_C0382 [Nitratiruptor sp. YY09-18]
MKIAKKIDFLKLIYFLLLFTSIDAYSQKEYSIFTASSNGDYYSLVIKANKKCNLHLKPVETRGSLDNIKKLIHSKYPTYAIVQGDVLDFVKKISNSDIKNKIKYVKKLQNYTEAIYVIRNKTDKSYHKLTKLNNNIKKIKNIKPISIGRFGSGSSITGYNLLTPLELNPNIVYMEKDEALNSLLNKKILMIVYVAKYNKKNNKIAKWVSNIIAQFPQYLELMEIDPLSYGKNFYQQTVSYKNTKLILIPTYFISTDSDSKKNMEIYQCLNY